MSWLSILQRTLSAPYRFLRKRYVHRYHQQLFDWHCRTFFPLHEHLSVTERQYLNACFALADDFHEVVPGGYDEYSYYTYSHRIDGEQVNSSRFAYGSILRPTEAQAAALPVLEEQGITIDPYFLHDPNSSFKGLGWDLQARHRKIYFRIHDLAKLPQAPLQALLAETPAVRRQEGLVSFTYIDGALHEDKVYTYPPADEAPAGELFPGTKGRVLMATRHRGTISQYDVSDPETWQSRLNPAGQAILSAYHKEGYQLDTIAMQDNEHFTLYFPW